MTQNKCGAVMVVGGGIAGMQYLLRVSSITFSSTAIALIASMFFAYFCDSITMAIPWPTPMHIVHSASLPPPV